MGPGSSRAEGVGNGLIDRDVESSVELPRVDTFAHGPCAYRV
jgi:hypothetical protein